MNAVPNYDWAFWRERLVGPATEEVPLREYAKVHYVSVSGGEDRPDAGSRERPWRTLRYALQRIEPEGTSRRVALLVAQGTYAEAPLHLIPLVDLFGGFHPETWERDIFRHRTMLTGEGVNRILVATNGVRIDGFVLADGKVRGKGAAVLCEGVSPIISNNTFIRNGTLKPMDWNPKFLHQTANDGGAIYCGEGAAPIIRNNLFIGNTTEAGRGAGVACHGGARARIMFNAFLNNTAGLDDPKRSSDGGAISAFDHSPVLVQGNVLIGNRAMGTNDAGGIFAALWSSVTIDHNILVDNYGDDDGGALFVGGQEHRYDRPLDPLPPAEEFFVRVSNNLFVANANRSRNSGAFRITMESRGLVEGNFVALNDGGAYFERSELTIRRNVILDNVLLVETKQGLRPSILEGNLIWGELRLEAPAELSNNLLRGQWRPSPDRLNDRRLSFPVLAATYSRTRMTTRILLAGANFDEGKLRGRVVHAGDRWGVVRDNGRVDIEVWGDFARVTSVEVLPYFE
jgi:hypothetical protein